MVWDKKPTHFDNRFKSVKMFVLDWLSQLTLMKYSKIHLMSIDVTALVYPVVEYEKVVF